MGIKGTKLKAKTGAKMAAALAGVASKKVADRLVEARDAAANRLVEAGDAALMKLSEGARKRKRTRALKSAGKALLVAGAAAATVMAGRAVAKRRKGR